MRKFRIQTLVMVAVLALGGPALAENFNTHLNGANVVPPFDTLAQGQFISRLRRNGDLVYKLNLANITNVVAAHIHCAPAGQVGPVGVTLFGGAPISVNGTLVQGPILAPDIGNGCGWVDLDDVIDALESGDTYINVHTLQSLLGEVRGQVN